MHSCHLLFDHFQFALIQGPNIPGSYAILLFIASDLASITSHIHSWVLFLLWLHPFLLSGVISPLICRSILGTYRPGEFIFQCPIFLPFHTVHGVLKARILNWFAIPFSSGPHSDELWMEVCDMRKTTEWERLEIFKKIRDTKGTFHSKMGSIKEGNGMDLTEAEDTKKRWQQYTEVATIYRRTVQKRSSRPR